MHRDLIADVRSVRFNAELSAYQSRFPYVSNAFPFATSGARHYGRCKKLIVESREHESALRRQHGYVGEEKCVDGGLGDGTTFGLPKGEPSKHFEVGTPT